MVINMKVNGKIIEKMELAKWYIIMVKFTQVNLMMIKKMVKVNYNKKMVKFYQEFGKMMNI